MDLNKLRYFLVVAETEHVTQAANMLGISQPALTRAIHRLEEELGVTLIAEDAVKIFSTQWQQTIEVCIESASAVVVDAIARYSREHPEVAFTVSQDEEARSSDIVIKTVSNITSTYASCHKEGSGVDETNAAVAKAKGMMDRTRERFTERIGIAVPISLLSSLPEIPSLTDLREAHFICLAGRRGFRRQCDLLCKHYGFAPYLAFESDNPSVVRKMIALGLGVGFWPEHSWGPVDPEKTLWQPLVEEGSQRTISIELTSQGIEKPAAREFRAFLLECFGEIWNG